MFQDIRPGVTVTCLVHAGIGLRGPEKKEASGRVVIVNRLGYSGPIESVVLNMGGTYGIPQVVTPENFVRIGRASRKALMH